MLPLFRHFFASSVARRVLFGSWARVVKVMGLQLRFVFIRPEELSIAFSRISVWLDFACSFNTHTAYWILMELNGSIDHDLETSCPNKVDRGVWGLLCFEAYVWYWKRLDIAIAKPSPWCEEIAARWKSFRVFSSWTLVFVRKKKICHTMEQNQLPVMQYSGNSLGQPEVGLYQPGVGDARWESLDAL